MPSFRRSPAVLLLALVVAACSSPTGSPSPSGNGLSSASAQASLAESSVAPTASPTATATPTIVPTAAPAATPKPSTTGPATLTVERIVSGLSSPVGVVNAGDGSGRLFVVQRGGQVRVIDTDGNLSPTPFFDIASRIVAGGEQGLLGLAFHPGFAANGRLFVDYTRAGDGATVISELTASADRGTASPASERILLTIAQPFSNHNGGEIAFGRDGYLYIGMGDGGSGGDPQGNGQNRQVLLGKILRIDVNAAHATGKEYAIPSTNPYAPGGISPGAGLPEIWAYGVRNPWRFSFDRANGDLYIGDVGQDAWEEVDRQPAGSRGGENYGWNAFEGTHCFHNCSGVSYVPPIVEYSHGSGCSVTGGYVYRGSAQPALKGIYVFGDYCSGHLLTLVAGAGKKAIKDVASTGLSISSFGEAESGEIYLVDVQGGGLYRTVVAS